MVSEQLQLYSTPLSSSFIVSKSTLSRALSSPSATFHCPHLSCSVGIKAVYSMQSLLIYKLILNYTVEGDTYIPSKCFFIYVRKNWPEDRQLCMTELCIKPPAPLAGAAWFAGTNLHRGVEKHEWTQPEHRYVEIPGVRGFGTTWNSFVSRWDSEHSRRGILC